MSFTKFRTVTTIFWIGILEAIHPSHATGISEAEVFEWWDDGTIAAEEADEILSLVDEGNMQQACALAEIYASHSCDAYEDTEDGVDPVHGTVPSHKKDAPKKRKNELSQKRYGGRILAKTRFDSTGTLARHREEIRFMFHNFTLLLGSRELLSYRSKRDEAHLGQVSTRELHSEIPLDTFWGTALAYSFGKVGVAALLDTAGTTSLQIATGPFRKFSAKAAYWKARERYPDNESTHDSESPDTPGTPHTLHSASLGLTFPFGHITTWYQAGQGKPLLHFRLSGRDSTAFSWRTSGYLHGSAYPQQARLSKSIAAHRFWTSQSVTFHAKEFLDTKVTASARIAAPLESDSISGRLALDMEGGPLFLRLQSKTTCREASNNCEQMIYQARLTTAHRTGNRTAAISGGVRAVQDRKKAGWERPRSEIATSITESLPGKRENALRIALVAPDSRPGHDIQIRSEARLAGEHLEFSLAATFRKANGDNFSATHAQLTTMVRF